MIQLLHWLKLQSIDHLAEKLKPWQRTFAKLLVSAEVQWSVALAYQCIRKGNVEPKTKEEILTLTSHSSVDGVVDANVASAVDANSDHQISIADLAVLDAN